MIYRPHKNRKNTPNFRVVIVLVVALCLGFIPFIRNLVITAYAHSAWFVREFTVHTLEKVAYPWREDKSNTEDEPRQEVESAELSLLRKENEDLKELLGRKPTGAAVLSRVLLKPPQAPYDELVLDVGQDEGVADGAELYDKSGAIVGVVTSAADSFSRARLFTSPGETIEAELLSSGIVLPLLGYGDGTFKVEVPRGFAVSVGDVFVLPGLKSHPLASVASIEEETGGSFKTIFARGVFEPRRLTWVFVETKK